MSGWNAPSVVQGALLGLCPRCGAQGLFAGMIRFATRCKTCDLDYESFNVGDGAAAFLIFIVATIDFAGIIIMQLALSPPWWAQALLWLPATIGLTIGLLRVSKAVLIAIEYRTAAREGKLSS